MIEHKHQLSPFIERGDNVNEFSWVVFGAVFAAISAVAAAIGAWFAYKAAPKAVKRIGVRFDVSYFNADCLGLKIGVDNKSSVVAEDVSLVVAFPNTWTLRHDHDRRGAGGMPVISNFVLEGNVAQRHQFKVVPGVLAVDHLLVSAPEGKHQVQWSLCGRNVPPIVGKALVHIPTIDEAKAKASSK